VALQERTIRRFLVDVTLDDFDSLRIQKTSGVTAGRSSGLPVEDWLGHRSILGFPNRYVRYDVLHHAPSPAAAIRLRGAGGVSG
jgi:hypothetical protein